MNDEKAKNQQGTGSLQREAEGSSSEGSQVEKAVAVVKDCDRKEASLFAQRGHGGYIETEALNKIRETRKQAQAIIEGAKGKAVR